MFFDYPSCKHRQTLCAVQELRQLQELEAAAGFLPDPEIDAFMKASCAWNVQCKPCVGSCKFRM